MPETTLLCVCAKNYLPKGLQQNILLVIGTKVAKNWLS
jgi:hypothetical protein